MRIEISESEACHRNLYRACWILGASNHGFVIERRPKAFYAEPDEIANPKPAKNFKEIALALQ